MKDRRLPIGMMAALPIFTMALLAMTAGAGPREKVLYNFTDIKDGYNLNGSLIFDAAGNLYSTTENGGPHGGSGTAFELIPTAGGRWNAKVLHTFGFHQDGSGPSAGMIFDGVGNLYGTTSSGGAHGDGTVFELVPKAGGGWTEKLLHTFGSNKGDGITPFAGLAFDAVGNLYGTTVNGGGYGCGTVFELSPKAGGGWTEKLLHDFNGKDGCGPQAGLILDAAGNLYGTTALGGAYSVGTVFELAPTADARWAENILLNFNGKGSLPEAGLIFDAAGNLYGTTGFGGSGACQLDGYFGCGTVFELTPKAGRGWTEKLLHDFNGEDGSWPQAGLIFDAAGNLYGTTGYGGSGACHLNEYFGCGTVFELTSKAGGGWTEKVLHSFKDNGKDGVLPSATLIFDAAGSLYGTTLLGGAYGQGTVFEIAP